MMSDSSESSADEEDRRLKPIRPRLRTGNEISTVDACDEPESYTSFKLKATDENSIQPFSDLHCVETPANTSVFPDDCINKFLPNVKIIAANTESSHNLIVGLGLIKQMFDNHNLESVNTSINSASSFKEESGGVHEVESNLSSKVILGGNKAVDAHGSFNDAGSQTAITGDIMPQDITQMVEYFQFILQDLNNS